MLTKQFVRGSWDGTHDRIGGLLGGVGPAESLKSGNSQQRCSSPQAPSSQLQPLASFLWLQLQAGAGACRQVQVQLQAQVPGVSQRGKGAAGLGSSWNGRTAEWLMESKSGARRRRRVTADQHDSQLCLCSLGWRAQCLLRRVVPRRIDTSHGF